MPYLSMVKVRGRINGARSQIHEEVQSNFGDYKSQLSRRGKPIWLVPDVKKSIRVMATRSTPGPDRLTKEIEVVGSYLLAAVEWDMELCAIEAHYLSSARESGD